MLEKEVVNDLVQSVEKAHKQDFWTVWATRGSPFEINLYNLHIQARKLESNDQLFTKYQVVETEREMDRFGMGKSQLSKPSKHKSSQRNNVF